MTPLAAVSWAAHLGWIRLGDSWLSFLGSTAAAYITAALALGELIADQLPSTPSRKSPPGFIGRVLSGAICGGALGVSSGAFATGAVAGIAGAVVGTLGGYEARVRGAAAVGKDLPVALIEDAIAIALAYWVVTHAA